MREEAAKALGRLKAKTALDDLRALMLDRSERVRWAAVSALDLIGDAAVIKILQEGVSKEKSEWIKSYAENSLTRIKTMEKYQNERIRAGKMTPAPAATPVPAATLAPAATPVPAATVMAAPAAEKPAAAAKPAAKRRSATKR